MVSLSRVKRVFRLFGSIFQLLSIFHFSHQIEAIMSDGSITTLKAGDVIVQRGTNHAWKNSTSEWTRVLFIVISAQEVLIDGKKMEGLHLP